MTTGRQSKKLWRQSFDEGVNVEVESVAKVEVIDVTQVASGALQSKTSAFQVLAAALKKYYFIKDRSFIELKDLHELQTSFSLYQNVNLVLVNPP